MKLLSLSLITVTLLVPSLAFSEGWSFMGTGPCRDLDGSRASPIQVYKNVSWNKCRQRCEENQNCRGVEYNLRTDHSVCELHGDWVTAGYTDNNDHVLSCWANDFPLPAGYSFPHRDWALKQMSESNGDKYYCCTEDNCYEVNALTLCEDSIKWECTEGTLSCWPE
jgi:hypothetical protein